MQHIWSAIRAENTEKLTAVFDKEKPIRSTEDVRTWYTSKPCESTDKSHISHCVYDSGWEASEAYFFDKSDLVESFVKNDHLGLIHAIQHRANDGCKVEGHQNAVVIDQKSDHELPKLFKLPNRPEGPGEAFKSDHQISFTNRQ